MTYAANIIITHYPAIDAWSGRPYAHPYAGRQVYSVRVVVDDSGSEKILRETTDREAAESTARAWNNMSEGARQMCLDARGDYLRTCTVQTS